jgi:hypothetical protein
MLDANEDRRPTKQRARKQPEESILQARTACTACSNQPQHPQATQQLAKALPRHTTISVEDDSGKLEIAVCLRAASLKTPEFDTGAT